MQEKEYNWDMKTNPGLPAWKDNRDRSSYLIFKTVCVTFFLLGFNICLLIVMAILLSYHFL